VTSVIVLNGGSSSGKSGIARCLQAILPTPWLTLSVDTLVDALPPNRSGIEFAADGEIAVHDEFRAAEDAWMAGVAAMARAGARIIVDDVFLSGTHTQQRWERALDGLPVLWVGVHCDAATARAREMARGDRVGGMAAAQAELVHVGVAYDMTVNTSHDEALACAEMIAALID
jgi:chloramphenicol 3-O phosphotransferase